MAKRKSSRKTAAALNAVETLSAPAWPTVRGTAEGVRVGYESFVVQGQASLTALAAANAVLSQTVERMSLEVASLARAAVESATEAGAGMVVAKSVEGVVALQYAFTKGCVERFIVGGARLSELVLKAAREIYAPQGARVEKTVETLKKPLAR